MASDPSPSLQPASPRYQLFMLALCVFALAVTVLQGVFRFDAEIETVLDHADNFICLFFLADFVVSLVRAPRKTAYLATWGWLDLLSSIPPFDAARWGRIARIARLARVLRILRASRVISATLFRQRQSVAMAAALLALFLIVGSSVAILWFETHPDSNITTGDDALWWAFATITTVGYGDRYPLTTEGRVVAALLMTAGVGLFGAFSATLAAWFLAPEGEEANAEIAAMRDEIAALRRALEERVLPPQTPGRGVSTRT